MASSIYFSKVQLICTCLFELLLGNFQLLLLLVKDDLFLKFDFHLFSLGWVVPPHFLDVTTPLIVGVFLFHHVASISSISIVPVVSVIPSIIPVAPVLPSIVPVAPVVTLVSCIPVFSSVSVVTSISSVPVIPVVSAISVLSNVASISPVSSIAPVLATVFAGVAVLLLAVSREFMFFLPTFLVLVMFFVFALLLISGMGVLSLLFVPTAAV